MTLDLHIIRQAEQVIRQYIHQTPVLSSDTLNRQTGSQLHFKCENFQKSGSFKIRGACYSVLSLPVELAQKGVVAHSVGNHGGALALIAKLRNIPVSIVVPSDAPSVKIDAIRQYGAEVIICDPTMEARESTSLQIVEEKGATYIPPFDSYPVMTGQGTLGLELFKQIDNIDAVVVPVGGGGLISGISYAIKALNPAIEVIGVEPTAANFAAQSLAAGTLCESKNSQLKTIADGLAAGTGKLTLPFIKKYVDELLVVDDELIVEAMELIWTRMKIIVEPAAAAALAAVLKHSDRFHRRNTVLIMTGGNVNLNRLPWS